MNDHEFDSRTLVTMGERFVKSRILERLHGYEDAGPGLIGGLGHDAGVLRNPLNSEESLLVNTDKSGMNKAYKLGLAGGECIGDFAVSHAVSDILATGGEPVAVSIAMLLPGNTTLGLVDEIVEGIQQACRYYGVTITGGDTKMADQLSLVVTAIGKAREDRLLFRNTPKIGDKLVVTGSMGSMLLGSIVHKRGHAVSESVQQIVDKAIVYQRPPYRLSLAMSEARLANACTDISDGLPAACRNMVGNLDLGVELIEARIPINPELIDLAESLSLSPLQLSMASGDWQFLYCVPEVNVFALEKITKNSNTALTVVGEVIETRGIWCKQGDGERRKIRNIENDSFRNPAEDVSYFQYLSVPQELYE